MRTLALLFALTISCFAQPLSPHDPAFLQSTSPLRRGLVGYWRLEEASGTRYDCSSTGARLTDNNSVGQAAGKVGNASTMVFASNQYLSCDNTNTLQLAYNAPFTICAWINLTTTGQNQILVSKQNGGFGGYSLSVVGGKLYTDINDVAGSFRVAQSTTASAVTNGVWHFTVATYDGSVTSSGFKLYLDNTLQTVSTLDSGALTSIANTANFCIGNMTGLVNRTCNGLVDEVGVWTRVLTTAELTQLYNAGSGTHFPWAHP